MARTLNDLMRERPGNPERRARFKAEMLEELRRCQLAETNADERADDRSGDGV